MFSFDWLCHPREPEIAFFYLFQVLALAIREVRIEAGAVLGNVQAFASKLVNAHPPMPLLHETSNFQTMTLQKKTCRDMWLRHHCQRFLMRFCIRTCNFVSFAVLDDMCWIKTCTIKHRPSYPLFLKKTHVCHSRPARWRLYGTMKNTWLFRVYSGLDYPVLCGLLHKTS